MHADVILLQLLDILSQILDNIIPSLADFNARIILSQDDPTSPRDDITTSLVDRFPQERIKNC